MTSGTRGLKLDCQQHKVFSCARLCVMLGRMGSKDKGRKEAKKAPKPKPKPEPGRKREIFTPPPPPK
jgi:hypothetical protein